MRALIDGDIVVFRAACSAEKEEPWVACARADKTILDILEDVHADSYSVFLTGSSNFRRELSPTYKANRPAERPTHWQVVRDYLVNNHKAVICEGCEADDYLGMEQDKSGANTTTICSIDKDLMQIPGIHYNFVKKEFKEVNYKEGRKFLYLQSLIGDRSDNIIGVVGIGPKKAERALEGLETEKEWYEVCLGLYGDLERFYANMQLLYIWQRKEDGWVPPV